MTTPDEARAEARAAVEADPAARAHRTRTLARLARKNRGRDPWDAAMRPTTVRQQWEDFDRGEARDEAERDRRHR